MKLPLVALGVLFVAPFSAQAEATLDQIHACRVAYAPREHVGETLVFQGEYLTDHIERSLIRPIGCERGIGLGDMAPTAEQAMDKADPAPWYPDSRRIVGVFEAKVRQDEPNGFQFFRDTGVRLDVKRITGLQVIDTGPPSWAQPH